MHGQQNVKKIAFLVLFSAIASSGTWTMVIERSVLGKSTLREFLR